MKKSLGNYLRNLRHRANFSLEELSHHTKIPVRHLQHLEKEEYEKLPPPVYVRGFLKVWAHVTKGDNTTLQHLFTQTQSTTVQENRSPKQRIRTLPAVPIITIRHIGIVFAILVCGVAGYIYYSQSVEARSPEIRITNPQELYTVSEEKVVTLRGTTHNIETLTIDGSRVPIVQGSFSHTYILDTGLNTISFAGMHKDSTDPVYVLRQVIYQTQE